VRISADNPVIVWFFDPEHEYLTKTDFLNEPLFVSMWEEERQIISDLEIDTFVPIRRYGKTVGLVLLTPKKNNLAYTPGDMNLLLSLASMAAIAMDNADMHTESDRKERLDSLTGLGNHASFRRALADKAHDPLCVPLSLALIDMDMFKLYNDIYGHAKGDAILKRVANAITTALGDRDEAFRYGGEEFSVILPGTDAKEAYELTEKIRLSVRDIFTGDVSQRILSASIGICTYPTGAPDMEELLKRTDFALYASKASGKNRTVVYSPGVAEMTGGEMAHYGEQSSYTTTIYALTAAIDAKDHFTFGHSQNVAELVTVLGAKLGMDKAYIEVLREAALLHDVGKIGIPEAILAKTSRLTDRENALMKKHVEISVEIIKHLPSLKYVVPAVIGHHERWDGGGYPQGLKGEDIPEMARCLAVADSFDAMTSVRPYKDAMSVDYALSQIEAGMGTQFDPRIAGAFVSLVRSGEIVVEKRNGVIPSSRSALLSIVDSI
jgi:diguanylate cyclase (GGDEF)-like protein/putative nucleotidyltransferase with HDIG domain